MVLRIRAGFSRVARWHAASSGVSLHGARPGPALTVFD
ncbi:Hypothetical protein A7982_07960 [Minicystis rosea]|nr:Hypothetical protein A7982_07960 [Minicystis rosea]